MKVVPIVPDAPVAANAAAADAGGFAQALDALGGALGEADRAENAFAYGSGTLMDAVYERARADVALSVAAATAQHAAQAVQSLLNMQV